MDIFILAIVSLVIISLIYGFSSIVADVGSNLLGNKQRMKNESYERKQQELQNIIASAEETLREHKARIEEPEQLQGLLNEGEKSGIAKDYSLESVIAELDNGTN